MWATHIVPTDRPSAEQRAVDVEAAVRNALEKRTDIVVARKNLENNDLSLRLARDRHQPQLDLVGDLRRRRARAARSSSATASADPSSARSPAATATRSSNVFGRDYPTWSRRRQHVLLDPQPTGEGLAGQGADLEGPGPGEPEPPRAPDRHRGPHRRRATWRPTSRRCSRRRPRACLSAQRLDAEEKKFAAGMSTNFLVTQAQRDLALAEVNELQSIADYRKSIIELRSRPGGRFRRRLRRPSLDTVVGHRRPP